MFPRWTDAAACRGEELVLFFGHGDGDARETTAEKEARVGRAKEICRRCSVRTQCLEWHIAFSAGQYGVAGGLDEDERRTYRRRQLRKAARERKDTS